jgi:hypothetical protein
MNRDPHPLELAAVAVLALAWAVWQITRLLLVPLLALVLVACGWRSSPAPRPSPEGFLAVNHGGGQNDRNPEPEAPILPSTVAALRQLARARGITTAGCRRVSQARKADLLVALA